MIEYLPMALSFIAGLLIYISLNEYIPEYLHINLRANKFFPVFVIVVLVCGLMVAQSIHLTEAIVRNTSPQQTISINWCLIENITDCTTYVNNTNNANYSLAVSESKFPFQVYIPVSLPYLIQKNFFTYFCLGILAAWAAILVGGINRAREE